MCVGVWPSQSGRQGLPSRAHVNKKSYHSPHHHPSTPKIIAQRSEDANSRISLAKWMNRFEGAAPWQSHSIPLDILYMLICDMQASFPGWKKPSRPPPGALQNDKCPSLARLLGRTHTRAGCTRNPYHLSLCTNTYHGALLILRALLPF